VKIEKRNQKRFNFQRDHAFCMEARALKEEYLGKVSLDEFLEKGNWS
jgi:hypothetical protein